MTRSPRRRLAAVAAIGVLAVGALAACRTDAGAAAFVGDTRISNDQVNQIVALVPPNLADTAALRIGVVNDMVFDAAMTKYANAHGVAAPPVTDDVRAQIAQGLQLPNDAKNRPLIDLEVRVNQWRQALLSSAPNTAPSDADLMQLFNELKADFQPGTTFDQAKPTLLQVPNVPQGLAVRKELEPAFQSYDISISPRYANNCVKAPCAGPYMPLVQYTPQGGQPIDVVNLPLTDAQASPPAVDLPAAASPAAPQQ